MNHILHNISKIQIHITTSILCLRFTELSTEFDIQTTYVINIFIEKFILVKLKLKELIQNIHILLVGQSTNNTHQVKTQMTFPASPSW